MHGPSILSVHPSTHSIVITEHLLSASYCTTRGGCTHGPEPLPRCAHTLPNTSGLPCAPRVRSHHTRTVYSSDFHRFLCQSHCPLLTRSLRLPLLLSLCSARIQPKARSTPEGRGHGRSKNAVPIRTRQNHRPRQGSRTLRAGHLEKVREALLCARPQEEREAGPQAGARCGLSSLDHGRAGVMCHPKSLSVGPRMASGICEARCRPCAQLWGQDPRPPWLPKGSMGNLT